MRPICSGVRIGNSYSGEAVRGGEGAISGLASLMNVQPFQFSDRDSTSLSRWSNGDLRHESEPYGRDDGDEGKENQDNKESGQQV
jgi:hypothetical protein